MAFSLGMKYGTLRYQGRLCPPIMGGLRERIMAKGHSSKYFVHSHSTKMYHDLKEIYWWNDIKIDIADFVAMCPNYQQVKAERQKPVSIISDRGTQFISNLWQKFQHGLGTQLNLSTSFHPQTDRQAEQFIQPPTYLASIYMSSFKALYGRRCRSHIGCFEVVEVELIGPDLVHLAMEKVAILDRQVRKLRNKEIASVKVLWQNQQVEEATWESSGGNRGERYEIRAKKEKKLKMAISRITGSVGRYLWPNFQNVYFHSASASAPCYPGH
uniref:Integrase zinc-binding domain-containing protein n=1 Tax=Nicotiana tabacum TaxID=4097 RepID=A0A1S3ZS52_TOBAC|nr:PREDICTED: uncharacterized protein LOC107789773 [Nicotiana tabacum]